MRVREDVCALQRDSEPSRYLYVGNLDREENENMHREQKATKKRKEVEFESFMQHPLQGSSFKTLTILLDTAILVS